jgi:hypothetical protein
MQQSHLTRYSYRPPRRRDPPVRGLGAHDASAPLREREAFRYLGPRFPGEGEEASQSDVAGDLTFHDLVKYLIRGLGLIDPYRETDEGSSRLNMVRTYKTEPIGKLVRGRDRHASFS